MMSNWYFIYSVILCSIGHCVGRCVLVILRVVVTSVSSFIMVPEWFQTSNWVSFVFFVGTYIFNFPPFLYNDHISKYRDSHYKDKMVINSYAVKVAYLYGNNLQISCDCKCPFRYAYVFMSRTKGQGFSL